MALLAAHGGEARIIAGGQSLLPALAFRLARPALLIDVRRLAELHRLVIDERGVMLGAGVRWRDILDAARLRTAHPLLVAAIGEVGHYAIRNRGTVGGSLAHADPAAEMPCIAVCCDAEIAVLGPAGERRIAAARFFEAPLTTALAEDELILDVRLAPWAKGRRWAFREFAQRTGDFALAGVAVHYEVDGARRACDAHIAVMGGCRRPAWLPGAEQLLNGRRVDAATAAAAAETAAEEAEISGDLHADLAYRRALVKTLLVDALLESAAPRMKTTFTVNGRPAEIDVAPRTTLADGLRRHLGLTGTHIGCEHGVCGACTVIVDGLAVRSCLMLAVQAPDAAIATVEGLAVDGALSPPQAAFRKHHALQCGFCTPGLLMTAHALLSEEPGASRERIREVLSGNLCRCTGYIGIVEAVYEARAAYGKSG